MNVIWVGIGGFIGAIARYSATLLTRRWFGQALLPIGTLAVNVLGCFLMGMLSQLSETYGPFSPEIRAFVFVGLLGGFTTFSAFGNETFSLWKNVGDWPALANIGGHIVLGLGAVAFGTYIGSRIWG